MPAGERKPSPAVSGEGGQDFSGLLADLRVMFGGLSEKITPGVPVIPWEACHPVWQPGQIPSGGTLDQADLFGPKDPYWWDVRSVKLWGFTAGTVTVYRNSTSGEQLAQATQTGEFTWSAQNLLAPRDHLIFGVTGLTGSVNLTVSAIEIQAPWLPTYLV